MFVGVSPNTLETFDKNGVAGGFLDLSDEVFILPQFLDNLSCQINQLLRGARRDHLSALGLHFIDEGLQIIDSRLRLPAINFLLGSVELG